MLSRGPSRRIASFRISHRASASAPPKSCRSRQRLSESSNTSRLRFTTRFRHSAAKSCRCTTANTPTSRSVTPQLLSNPSLPSSTCARSRRSTTPNSSRNPATGRYINANGEFRSRIGASVRAFQPCWIYLLKRSEISHLHRKHVGNISPLVF